MTYKIIFYGIPYIMCCFTLLASNDEKLLNILKVTQRIECLMRSIVVQSHAIEKIKNDMRSIQEETKSMYIYNGKIADSIMELFKEITRFNQNTHELNNASLNTIDEESVDNEEKSISIKKTQSQKIMKRINFNNQTDSSDSKIKITKIKSHKTRSKSKNELITTKIS